MIVMFPKNNNLEWLRLLFAAQVVISHTGGHMGVEMPIFISKSDLKALSRLFIMFLLSADLN